MKVKTGANIYGLQLSMRRALIIAEQIWSKHGQELVVTSAVDGEHTVGSLHYYGLAVDLRTRYWDEDTQIKVFDELTVALPIKFKVIFHTTHIHIENREFVDGNT